MRLSVGMKVGLVSLFSCLALLLGLFSSTGIASAHTANTQSVHVSANALADDSAANDCPGGTVSTTTFDKGEAPKTACADPSSDPPPTAIYYQHDDRGHLR